MIYDLNHRVMASEILSRLKTRNNDDEQGGLVVVVQSFSRVQLFVTPWTATCQAALSITNSQSLLKLMSIESSDHLTNHLILCRPLLLLPSIFPRISVFSNKSVLRIRGPKYIWYNKHKIQYMGGLIKDYRKRSDSSLSE